MINPNLRLDQLFDCFCFSKSNYLKIALIFVSNRMKFEPANAIATVNYKNSCADEFRYTLSTKKLLDLQSS